MHDQNDNLFYAQIESARRVNRSAAEQYAQKGLQPVQIGMAAVYSAFDIAERMHDGNGVAAIEWLRSALDVMERSLLNGDERA